MSQQRTAAQKRAAHPEFAPTFAYAALAPQLPLRLPEEADISPSPKSGYRSHYRYLGHADLADATRRASLSPFEITLRLIDLSNLRDELASRLYQSTDRGQTPFDPVSMLLCLLLRLEQGLAWVKLAKLLAGPKGNEWRRLFGFQDGQTPSASGLRYCAQTLGPDYLEDLCGRFVQTLFAAGLAQPHSTYPGDDPSRGVTICRDGQLHTARDRLRDCHCPEPCPAVCPEANRRDHEARLIHYSGRNKDAKEGAKSQGKTVFGYRSTADRLLDDRFSVAWTVRSGLYPANTDEHTVFEAELLDLEALLGGVDIGEFLADAGLGYGPALARLYERRILRMVDIRADALDGDPERQRQRGYDESGRPLCLHGFAMSANGYDHQRQRAKYICARACTRQTEREVPDCPFLKAGVCGQVVNVGLSMPDGSLRLARDIPYGSKRWKDRYGRRNNAECRNSQLQALGLLRLPCHGLRLGRIHIALADFLINLRTLGRLVAEASRLET
jgi:hypothetical protein